MNTADAARGKWPEILKRFGVDDKYLRNKHGPCPICGGKDRFRFDDKGGEGTYYCNGCGAGNGFDLLLSCTGMTFKEAANEIDKFVGNIDAQPAKPKKDPSIALNAIIQGLDKRGGVTPVRLYLKSRGLMNCKALRYHPGITYYDDGKPQGKWPAMVAYFLRENGKPCTLHITYLTSKGLKAPVDSPRKFKPGVCEMPGGAIRLTDIYPPIGIAEGIETALAVMAKFQIPCWATGTAGNMEAFKPPQGIERVTIFGDNDSSYTGQKAAYTAAHKLTMAGYGVDVEIAPEVNTDFADYMGETA